jgi:2-polyprenyl-3-methyl-5-hydroxy-6-metoxy-1,4-benzoquinol methylase
MSCLFCRSTNVEQIKNLPANIFDQKQYAYLKCRNCELVFIDPIPTNSDLANFYPESYQGEIHLERVDGKRKQSGLRFAYQLHYDIIKSSKGKNILDFGCGNGHFIYNASHHELIVDGVEFSASVISKLKTAIPTSKFYTRDEFYKTTASYDIIRMSNVLEHFTEPLVEFEKLKDKISKNGLMIIEGPLEKNRSLVNTLKWNYFVLRKKLNGAYKTTHVPTHIFFSNYKNQLDFFESMGMRTEKYILKENAWPYPEKLSQVNSISSFVKHVFAKCSILMSYLLPDYGNTFLYVGRKG